MKALTVVLLGSMALVSGYAVNWGFSDVAGSDGRIWAFVYYYTDLRQRDNKITDGDLNPGVCRDGKVAGIGNDFLGRCAPKAAQIL